MKHIFSVLLVALVMLGIVGCETKKREEKQISLQQEYLRAPLYMQPQIPYQLSKKEERLVFLLDNYWKRFNFNDNKWLNYPNDLEKVYVDYIALLTELPIAQSRERLDSLYRKLATGKVLLNKFYELSDKYFYDAASPYRNEELYLVAVRHFLNEVVLDSLERTIPLYQQRVASQNQVGRTANDFKFTTIGGRSTSLYKEVDNKTILMFLNPDCEACEAATNELKSNQFLQDAIKWDSIKIIAMYVDGEIDQWKEYAKTLPDNWIKGYDPTLSLRNSDIYNLNAIPTLYLLNADRIVEIKDGMPCVILEEIKF